VASGGREAELGVERGDAEHLALRQSEAVGDEAHGVGRQVAHGLLSTLQQRHQVRAVAVRIKQQGVKGIRSAARGRAAG
jgi:hypothetical protein